MDAVHPSLENFGLHRAAAAGDDDELRYALRSGADVNALDAAGKTALMCAIAGNEYVSSRPYERCLCSLFSCFSPFSKQLAECGPL
jgi:ankyrin repeat protein